MRLTVRAFCSALLFGLAVFACSSDKAATGNTPDGGEATGGKGGGGAGGKGGGIPLANGGDDGAGGALMMCAADAGGAACSECLAGHCCSDFQGCLADPTCVKALADQAKCYGAPGAEPSDCFGTFTRTLSGTSGLSATGAAIQACEINSCDGPCGGPHII